MISAAVTLVALLFAIYSSRRSERRLAEQQAAADKLLGDERAIAEQRLADERAHTERLRQRERQQDSARRLLQHLAELLPMTQVVPYSDSPLVISGDNRASAARHAVERLRFGAVADLPGLQDAQAAEQYKTLVHLAVTVARGQHMDAAVSEEHGKALLNSERNKLAAIDLLRYGVFVRLSLERLIEHGESLDSGLDGAGAAYPMFSRRPGDQSQWSPPMVSQDWTEAISREPGDPQYRPAP